MSDSYSKNLSAKALIWSILFTGICLRLNQYLSNKSLWIDELWITFNIINKSFIDLLTKPLDYHQCAPVGFLMTEKVLVSFLGNNEYILRLFPLLCSIASLFVFYKLIENILNYNAMVFAILLFAASKHFIYHASEAKQYSSDLLIALILFLLTFKLINKPDKNPFHLIRLGIFGFIFIWFSHSSIFVLISVSIILLSLALLKKNNNMPLKETILLIISWIVSFFLNYVFNLSKVNIKALGFKSHFMPWPPDFSWLSKKALMLISSVGFEANLISVFFLLFGSVLIFKKSRTWFFILLLPLIFTLAASAIHKYPIHDRLMLFYFPVLIIFFSNALEHLRKKIWSISSILGIAFICMILFPYLSGTYKIFINPYKTQEMKPILNYLKSHEKSNDVLYICEDAEYAFKYYGKRYGFTDEFDLDKDQHKKGEPTFIKDPLSNSIVIISRKYSENIFTPLIGKKRLWILFSNVGINETFILNTLDKIGAQVASFIRRGANGGCSLFLYDLSLNNHG